MTACTRARRPGLLVMAALVSQPSCRGRSLPASSAPYEELRPLLAPGPGEVVTFQHVAPILAARCAKCPTENGLMGPCSSGISADVISIRPGDSRPGTRVPGKVEASELVRRIRGQTRPRMALNGPPYLSNEEIRLIEDWLRQGTRNATQRRHNVTRNAITRPASPAQSW